MGRNWGLSFLIHAVLLLTLILVPNRKKSGTVSVMEIELAGPAGAGLHAEIQASKKMKRPVVTKSIAKKVSDLTFGSNVPSESISDSGPSGKATDGIGSGGGNSEALGLYILTITRMINSAKKYPKLALMREEEGQVLVSFDVSPEGNITNVKLESPSAFDSLNGAALETVQALGKLPNLPVALAGGAHLHIPLRYRINRQ